MAKPSDGPRPPALDPRSIEATNASRYPAPFRDVVKGRWRKRLGEAARLSNFGVNLVTLDPGSQSSIRHWHAKQDEFVYVLEGELELHTDAGKQLLRPGMAAGFPAGVADGHCLVNASSRPAVYLEVGDRTPGEAATYPDADLAARETDTGWSFTHKDGRPYE